jgi:hypothetical protein
LTRIRTKDGLASRVLGLALAVLGISVFSAAQEMALDTAVQYRIFMKILKYDKNLTAKIGSELVIGLLFQSGFRSSYLAKENFFKAMTDSPIKQFESRPIRCAVMDLDKEIRLEESISRFHVDVLYIAPLRAYDLASLLSIAQSLKLITLTGVPEYVGQGVAVGLQLKGDKPEILIYLAAAKAEGADFSSNLLKLARIIRGREEFDL